jgi:hypothetical protein
VAGAQQLDQRVRDAVAQRRTRRQKRQRQLDRTGVTGHKSTILVREENGFWLSERSA